jgi:hypothetical protein
MKILKSLIALVFLCGMTVTLGCSETETPETTGAGSGTEIPGHDTDEPDMDHDADEDGGAAADAAGGDEEG